MLRLSLRRLTILGAIPELDQHARRVLETAAAWGNKLDAPRGIVPGVAVIFLLLGSPATAQNRLKNIELCNGADRTSAEPQINGCTALIEAGNETPHVSAIAYNNRGNAYAAKGDYDRAIEDYGQSIKLDPGKARPFNNRGVAYRKKGEYDQAIKDFDEAIKLNPNYASAFANRAETYQRKHEHARAAQDYDEAIRLQPNLKAVWNGRCWARAIVGDLQAALADCNKALDLEPNAATFDSRGFIYLKMGQFETAIADYSSALELNPRLASALYGRGLAKLKNGDTAGGNADLAAASAIEARIAEDFARYGVQ